MSYKLDLFANDCEFQYFAYASLMIARPLICPPRAAAILRASKNNELKCCPQSCIIAATYLPCLTSYNELSY